MASKCNGIIEVWDAHKTKLQFGYLVFILLINGVQLINWKWVVRDAQKMGNPHTLSSEYVVILKEDQHLCTSRDSIVIVEISRE